MRRQPGPSEGASEFSLALAPAVVLVLDAARAPIRCSAPADKFAAEFPDTDERHRTRFLEQLPRVRLLRSSLRAAATLVGPTTLLPSALRRSTRTHTTAPDVRLDASVRLPTAVETEAETAATILTRLARHPTKTEVWRRYAERFADRFGGGTLSSMWPSSTPTPPATS